MYKPDTVEKLLLDSAKLLNFLQVQGINVDDGYQVIDIIKMLNEY